MLRIYFLTLIDLLQLVSQDIPDDFAVYNHLKSHTKMIFCTLDLLLLRLWPIYHLVDLLMILRKKAVVIL